MLSLKKMNIIYVLFSARNIEDFSIISFTELCFQVANVSIYATYVTEKAL
jgi:hypothetical protein